MDTTPTRRLRALRLARRVAVVVLALVFGVPQGSTPSFAGGTTGWQADLLITSSLQGQALPLSTVTGEPTFEGPPMFTLSGTNLALELTNASGRAVYQGSRPAGRVCLSRTYKIRANGATEVGGFTERLVMKSGAGTTVLWRYSTANIGSPLDVDYVITQTRDVPVPAIEPGDRLIWQFSVVLDSPVTTYDETSGLTLGRCPGVASPRRVAVSIVRAD
jgi:hypothetical protein